MQCKKCRSRKNLIVLPCDNCSARNPVIRGVIYWCDKCKRTAAKCTLYR